MRLFTPLSSPPSLLPFPCLYRRHSDRRDGAAQTRQHSTRCKYIPYHTAYVHSSIFLSFLFYYHLLTETHYSFLLSLLYSSSHPFPLVLTLSFTFTFLTLFYHSLITTYCDPSSPLLSGWAHSPSCCPPLTYSEVRTCACACTCICGCVCIQVYMYVNIF
jgi:hypothetical protein